MSKFKFRFSYFILIGILGFILQIISFFCFSNLEITAKDIMSTSSSAAFYEFIANNIVLMISCLCVGTMFVGYYIGKKKQESSLFQLSSGFVVACQGFIFVITLVYLIFATVVRTQLFDSKTTNMQFVAILAGTRYIYLVANYLAIGVFAYSLSKTRNNTKFSSVCNYFLLSINGLSALLLIVVLATSGLHSGFNMLINMYELKSLPPYEATYPILNGFTLSQLTRLSYVPFECELISGGSNLVVGSYLASAAIITFVSSAVYNLFWSVVHLIESFDIDRDYKLMEI